MTSQLIMNVFKDPTRNENIIILAPFSHRLHESCYDGNFQCSQWQKYEQNDDISVLIYLLNLIRQKSDPYLRYKTLEKHDNWLW